MTFEDKYKAKCVIYELFDHGRSDLSKEEIDRLMIKLSFYDLNGEEYEEVLLYLSRMMMDINIMFFMCNSQLKRSMEKDEL